MKDCSVLGPGWREHRIRYNDGTYNSLLLYTHMCGSTTSSLFCKSTLFQNEQEQKKEYVSSMFSHDDASQIPDPSLSKGCAD
jgi:hypothetical protein